MVVSISAFLRMITMLGVENCVLPKTVYRYYSAWSMLSVKSKSRKVKYLHNMLTAHMTN